MRHWNSTQLIRDTPDVLTLAAIRQFFVKRPFARPPDWLNIDAMKPMYNERRRELSLWIDGYLAAHDTYSGAEDIERLKELAETLRAAKEGVK
jgi:hypothetical protein